MGRIDVHAHLLPCVDDGCNSVAQSVAMAATLVAAGYSHLVCTPHVWPSLQNTAVTIALRVGELQGHLNAAGVPLTLLPGGEMQLSPRLLETPIEDLVTYNFAGRYMLFDFWTDEIPSYFEPAIRRLTGAGVTPILAHPERIEAVQNDPSVVTHAGDLGLLLQCNLECVSEGDSTLRGRLATQWLREGRYFMLGTDMHRPEGLARRLRGLERAADLVGHTAVDRLTIDHPAMVVAND